MGSKLTDAVEPVRLGFYGDGGVGKTTALLALAKLGPVVVISSEQGVKTRQLREVGIPVDQIEICPGLGENFDYRTIDTELDRIDAALRKNPKAYAGVILDGATEMYAKFLDAEVKLAYAKAQRLGKPRDEHFVDLADYGPVTSQMRKLLRKAMDLPCHLGISIGVKREQDDNGKVTYIMDVGPAVRKSFIALLDMIGYFSTQEVEGVNLRKALFEPRGKHYGKNRLGGVPPVLIDPSFDRVVGYVERKITVEKDPIMKNARDLAEKAKASADAKPAAAPAPSAN